MESYPVEWFSPTVCTPPHRAQRLEQVDDLAEAFSLMGWNPAAPALIGYRWGSGIQLLSGSHRWAAAMKSKLDRIPIVLIDYLEVHRAWGDVELWKKVMTPKEAGRRV